MNQEIFITPQEWAPQQDRLRRIEQGWAAEFLEEHGHAPRYAITTFGCQMNEHDSEHLNGLLQMAGFVPAAQEDADLLLFNTCCVREHAEARVFGNVGALQQRKKDNPELLIGVCGCMMQQQDTAAQLFKRFPFVDMVFGTHALPLFPQILETALRGERVMDVHESKGRIAEGLPTVRQEKTSAYLTVMFGCNNFCSFCIVPHVRGRERSRRMEDILADLRALAADGVREVTLLGQNVNSYGKDRGGGELSFPNLLRRANAVEGLERIRFMTSHPKDLSDDLIVAMAECDKVCKHIHLPVQSGSDRILQAMNRRYTAAAYMERLDKLRQAMPDIDVTTDIIVGFPAESEEDFAATLALVEQARYASAFTFMYSPRKGTPAATLPGQIPKDVQKERLYRLNALQAEMTRQNNEQYIGKVVDVLVEGQDRRKTTMGFGKTDSFKMVYFPSDEDLSGQCVRVRVCSGRQASLLGERTENPAHPTPGQI